MYPLLRILEQGALVPTFLTSKTKALKKMSINPRFFSRSSRTNIYDPFSLDAWEPFHGFPFNASSSCEPSEFVIVQVDWRETPELHIFKADLPGLKKEQVKVEVEDGRVLKISGERSSEEDGNNVKWHRIERLFGKFLRRFRLPEDANVEGIQATIENGVLTVLVRKEKIKEPQVKSVEISVGEKKKNKARKLVCCGN